MTSYPRIEAVEALKGERLLVTFKQQIKKIYNCTPLLQDEFPQSLSDETLFQSVKADDGGYGISWNDEIDLSESELWINGVPASIQGST